MSNSGFYYSDAPYLQALQELHRALSAPEALVKFIGQAHTGKSTLCEKLVLYMRHKGYRVVYFRYALESPDMLRAMLARELDLPNSTNFARMLEDIPLNADGKPLILIFDEAHLLSDITLLEIHRLLEVQSHVARKLNIVLCGEPALEQKLLRKPELKSLLQQVSHSTHLRPMSAAEQSGFLVAYLEKAGMPGLILAPAALNWFCKSSNGLPGPTQTLCRLIVAARRDDSEIQVMEKPELLALVRQAQGTGDTELLAVAPVRDTNRWVILGPVAVVVVIASIGMLYQQLVVPGSEAPTTAETAVTPVDAMPDSPFVTDVPAATNPATTIDVPDIGPVAGVEPTLTPPAENPVPDVTTATPDAPPASDSDLVLVTAAERGVAPEVIVEPIFEEVQRDGASVPATVEQIAAANADAVASAPVSNASPITASPTAESPQAEPAVAAQATAAIGAITQIPAVAQVATAPAATEEIPVAGVVANNVATDTVADIAAAGVASVVEPSDTDTRSASTGTAAVDVSGATPSTVAVSADAALTATPLTDTPLTDEALADATAAPGVLENQVTFAAPDERTDVLTWIAAWQAQDLASYLGSYHPEFVPRYHSSRERWQQDRTRVIGNARSIRLSLSDYTVVSSTNEEREVQFWLDYASPTYADSTLKKLVLRRQGERWLIVEEVNLTVRRR